MKADLRVLNLFFDPAGRLFGLLDDPSTKRPEVKTQRYVCNLLPAMKMLKAYGQILLEQI